MKKEFLYLSTLNVAVLAHLEAEYTFDEAANTLTLDEDTISTLEDITRGRWERASIEAMNEGATSGESFTAANLDTILDDLRDVACEIGYSGELDAIAHFGGFVLERDHNFNPTKLKFTQSEIARAIYKDADENKAEIFEHLAAYAIEELANDWENADEIEEEEA